MKNNKQTIEMKNIVKSIAVSLAIALSMIIYTGMATESTYANPYTATGGDTQTCGEGFMTGGGSIFCNGLRVTHGFELYCSTNENPNNLEVNFDSGNHFHLEAVTSVTCFLDPNFNPTPPNAPFNTLILSGTGSYNGVTGATIQAVFTDAGEPGSSDTATYFITDAGGNVVLNATGSLTFGNHQAHKLTGNR